MPQKEKIKDLNDVCAKDGSKEKKWHTKWARIKFCTY